LPHPEINTDAHTRAARAARKKIARRKSQSIADNASGEPRNRCTFCRLIRSRNRRRAQPVIAIDAETDASKIKAAIRRRSLRFRKTAEACLRDCLRAISKLTLLYSIFTDIGDIGDIGEHDNFPLR
jgi:hypothetical protein